MTVRELITEHLDLWTGAVKRKSSSGRGNNGKVELTGVKKLRELILELAVRGKLVEQYPADTSADQILERIAELRKELIAAKEIKNSNPLPVVTPDEAPSELPAGWAWTRLGSIAEINPRNTGDDTLETSFIPMPLITTSYHGEHGDEARNWGQIKKGYSHFANGDIGLAKITPCFENSKAAIFRNLRNGMGAGTTELHVARPLSSDTNPYFLLLFLKSPRFLVEGEKVMTGSAGQKRVPKDYFAETPLPLPPKEEQHRIVQKVDELMALCDRLGQQTSDQIQAHEILVDTLLGILTQSENATELADNWGHLSDHFDTLFTTEQSINKLKQAILQLAVMGRLAEQNAEDECAQSLLKRISEEKYQFVAKGVVKKLNKLAPIQDEDKRFKLPNGWVWTRLEDVFISIVDCPHSTPRFIERGRLCLDTNSFKEGNLNHDRFRYVSDETFEKRNVRLRPRANDIIFAREGSVGESVVIPHDLDCCLGQRVMLFRPSRLSEPNFLRLTLSNPLALDALLSLHKGIGAKHVNVGDMRKYVIALPPADEQHRIIQKVDELLTLCDQLKKRLNHACETRCQLAEAALAGVVHDSKEIAEVT
ncbi:MAG: restriction endonuclease subunit S [Haliea sp.]